ncbi:MAG: DNA mismatch repair endonuclease MutH, partial [Shewanella sp.]
MKPIIPPIHLDELLERANMLAGISLAQIAG